MKTKDFSFELPERLIAQHPTPERSSARLMRLPRGIGEPTHHRIPDLPGLLPQDSLLVLNTSRVRKARLFAERPGRERKVECLLLSSDESRLRWTAMLGRAGRLRPGGELAFPENLMAVLIEAEEGQAVLEFTRPVTEDYLELHGHVPLPPYIKRSDEAEDSERYQTVFAEKTGSAAAPTAGLHLDTPLLEQLSRRGIEIARLTLHVGLGTFSPVRSEDLENHVMHSEWYEVPPTCAEAVSRAAAAGRPVIAVGTTALRTLESAWDSTAQRLRPGAATTDIFIKPGYTFQVVDGLLTNFHTPESTLLMLVSAFAGRERILSAYNCAVQENYRFFSYGDAMLIF